MSEQMPNPESKKTPEINVALSTVGTTLARANTPLTKGQIMKDTGFNTKEVTEYLLELENRNIIEIDQSEPVTKFFLKSNVQAIFDEGFQVGVVGTVDNLEDLQNSAE